MNVDVGLFLGSEEHSSTMPCTKVEGGGARKGDPGTYGRHHRGTPPGGRPKPTGGNGRCYEESASRSNGNNNMAVRTPKPDPCKETKHPPPLPLHPHPRAPNHTTQPPPQPGPLVTPKPDADSLGGQLQPLPALTLTPPTPGPSIRKTAMASTTSACTPYANIWIERNERNAQPASSSNKSTT